MAGWWYLFRFFRVVSPVPRLTRTTFVVLTTAGCVKVVVDPGGAAAALLPVIVLQAFAASSGFAVPARRGYYDLLLTRAEGRTRIAMAHWAASVAPGLLAWLTLTAVEMMMAVAGAPAQAAGLASGTVLAFLLMSTVPWAITVPLPRFAGAIGWLLLVVTATSFFPVPAWVSRLSVARALTPEAVATALVQLLVLPLGLIGQRGQLPSATVSVGVAVSMVAMAAALVWIHRADFPLEASQ